MSTRARRTARSTRSARSTDRMSAPNADDEERLDACAIVRILEEQQDLGHKALEQLSLQIGDYHHKGLLAVTSVQDGLDALQQRLIRP